MSSFHGGTGPVGGDDNRSSSSPPGIDPYPASAPHVRYGDPRPPPPDLDGVSIASMVLAMTSLAAPVGIVLAVAGLVRTRGGRRKGRWAAVTGLVVGVLVTTTMGAALAAYFYFENQNVSYDEAYESDCIDVDGPDVRPSGCEERHDAEVLYGGTLDDELLDTLRSYTKVEFCRFLPLDIRYDRLFDDNTYAAELLVDSSEPDRPKAGDPFLCFVEMADGSDLTEQLLGNVLTTAGEIYPDDLSVGDCFNHQIHDYDKPVKVVDCAEPHDREVISSFEIDDGKYPGKLKDDKYPGKKAVARYADARCGAAYETYVGAPYERVSGIFGYYYPTWSGWDDGDRTVICLAYPVEDGEQLVGSVRNSGKPTA